MNETYPSTDQDYATVFLMQHHDSIRYCRAWRRWVFWDGFAWTAHGSQHIMENAKATAREFFRKAQLTDDPTLRARRMRHANSMENFPRMQRMVSLAAKDPSIQIAPADIPVEAWPLHFQIRSQMAQAKQARREARELRRVIEEKT